ncbi:hypothetical protein GGF43_005475, partial [Coemansia sp. RSA 2618]
LCKANSIEGNKKDDITIIYTPWSNLLKRGDMATGQVSFKSTKTVKRIHVPTRSNAIINRLNKTKREEFPDLALARMERDREEARVKKNLMRKIVQEEKMVQEERRKIKEESDYGRILEEEARKLKMSGKANKVSEDLFGGGSSDDDNDDGGARVTSSRFDDDFSDLL